MEAYQKLESEIGEWAGYPAENVVACSSGTAALHLAIEALRLPQGSQVIVPTFTMIACARAVSLAGLEPVFVDCAEDLLLDAIALHEHWPLCRLTPGQDMAGSVNCIMAVHVYGRQCFMKPIHVDAKEYGMYVIEDMAEAHGVKPHPATDAACWSFYKNKIVAGEEGGAVAFKNRDHAELARSLRSLGTVYGFNHVPRGHNYRLANCLAEKIRKALAAWGKPMVTRGMPYGLDILQQRRLIESWYAEECPDEWKMPPREVVWVYDVRIKGMSRLKQNECVERLIDAGIQARHAFKPMHTQEEYKNCKRVGGEVAEMMSREVLYLPVQPGVTTRDDCKRAFDVIRDVLKST